MILVNDHELELLGVRRPEFRRGISKMPCIFAYDYKFETNKLVAVEGKFRVQAVKAKSKGVGKGEDISTTAGSPLRGSRGVPSSLSGSKGSGKSGGMSNNKGKSKGDSFGYGYKGDGYGYKGD